MDEKEFLNSLSPYFAILKEINMTILKINEENMNDEPNYNEEKMYKIVSQLLRILPYIKNKKTGDLVITNNGIIQLKKYLPFIKDDYSKIIEKSNYQDILNKALTIRNKFTHEPHNMHFSFCVGGKSSFSMGVYYKDNLLSLGTIELLPIVSELNKIFVKVVEIFNKIVDEKYPNYKSHPYYKFINSCDFKSYNSKYTILPKYF